ncbi:hypothetical protein [uncultured Clostridium sp.]|jgi:hypothetical protein|uniref:hypothetical protein n=1 Tax=uncultured Clostridium sp. TaxID=59620 RepID=UPI00261DC377|nr:hypothetical protein [uncultured Clostridium sp.]
MNSISPKEIESQLLFFTRESIKHLVFESKCGVPISQKTLKKTLSESEYSKIKELNPVLAIYKKAKPNIYYSKHSKLWDETSFKKDILISSNALMTLSLLKLAQYYKSFKNIDDKLYELSKTYVKIAKVQLDFYYENLRNAEGFFVDKKNISNSNTSFPDLVEGQSAFSFADQAYMMAAYYSYSKATEDPKESETFKSFALEVLDMFEARKEFLYDESIEECSNICYALNIMCAMSKNSKCKSLLLDMSDFILSQYLDYGIDEKDMSLATITSINLFLTYNNTGLLTFKESFSDICKLFKSLFNEEMGTFIKPGDKKDIKYYNIESVLYLVNLMLYNKSKDDKSTDSLICNFFKQSIVHSSLMTSFPNPPNLDCAERYKHFSSNSSDLLDDLMFCLPDITTPESNCIAPVYLKSTSYSKKKSEFASSKTNFESFNNLFLDYIVLDLFLDDYLKFISPIPKHKTTSSKSKNDKKARGYRTMDDLEVKLPKSTSNKLKDVINTNVPLPTSSINMPTLDIEAVSVLNKKSNFEDSNIIDVSILNDNLSTIDYEELDQ